MKSDFHYYALCTKSGRWIFGHTWLCAWHRRDNLPIGFLKPFIHRILFAFVLLASVSAWAGMDTNYCERVVNAIWQAEGGSKAHYPYGIIAKRPLTEPEARRWCRNTVRNNWTRWTRAGSQGDYLEFLQVRYAPTKGATNDPRGLNRNWLKNVRFYMKGK